MIENIQNPLPIFFETLNFRIPLHDMRIHLWLKLTPLYTKMAAKTILKWVALV